MSHPENLSFWRRYVFSTDHKVIALQYLITGLVMAAIAGFLAYVIRMQLAWPNKPILGFGAIDPATYNGIISMHGTIMIFWVAMPVLVAAFGNYLVPLMVGTDDMAFPRLNMVSYWLFLASAVVLLSSFFVPGGPDASGWTVYPPLSTLYSGVGVGMTLWILALAIETAAFLLGGINLVTTALNQRAPGMKLFDMPLFVWEEIVATVVFLIAVGPAVTGLLMLLADHALGTGFFDPAKGGDPLLFEHLFWFFGHPEVYVLLLPATGIVAEVITAHSRKALFGYRMMVYATLITGVLSFVVWAHHQFVSGIDPRLATPFSLTTILISVPVAVVFFCFIATLWGGSIRFTTAMTFVISMIATFLLGGVTGIMNGSATPDMYLHGTAWIVAHFHYTLFPCVFMATFAGIYHWYPKIFGRMMSEPLGLLHAAGTFVFFNMTFLPQFVMGLAGEQRRIADPSQFAFLAPLHPLEVMSTMGAIGTLVSQIPFVWNFFASLELGRKADPNPWQATTLEWATPSPPPHGNFLEAPVCYRGPYVYSPKDLAVDFVPQNVPPERVSSLEHAAAAPAAVVR